MQQQKLVLGRTDILDFPALDLFGIEVKIDTGAYTSSFHCHRITEYIENGKKKLKCNFLDPSHPEYNEREYCFDDYSTRTVKSSNGAVEVRFSITTTVKVFQESYPIELTLTERSEMKFSVLLGRAFLKKWFIVNPGRTNLSKKEIILEAYFKKRN